MLGSYRLTRENINFTPRDAMNLLMMSDRVNTGVLQDKGGLISSFDVLSQIMAPLSLKYKNKAFNDEKDDFSTSNNVLEIRNGKYIRGQLDKGVLGGGTKGLIQRTCNEFGNMNASQFIDDLQNVVTDYMMSSSFSVGISDLKSDTKTKDMIVDAITKKKTEVKNLIDQTQLGVFKNNTGRTNVQEFETQVNNILNKASSDAGKIGLASLDKNNRFVVMVKAGSKGSDLNISQMISCLGQQNVDGKRIPYGFDQRTLPHYTKYDDTPASRGFVESSYINGLSPQELFFHAMGGRVGLIDTAVKTSTTGYIQRRLVKGLEDLMVGYDMTIRTNKNKIVQFSYGEDSIDTIKVENQVLPIVSMTIQEIYSHYTLPDDTGVNKEIGKIFEEKAGKRYKKQKAKLQEKNKQYTDLMLEKRDGIIKNVFKNKGDNVVNLPVAFSYIINNIQGQQAINSSSMVDITPLEAYNMIEATYEKLETMYYTKPTELFKVLYYYYLSPKDLLLVKRFNQSAMVVLLDTIVMTYKRAIVSPGEMVGMTAGQSIGETSTQMTLNTFHFAGVASKSNVTRGVPRIEEILSLTGDPKNPSLTVYLKPEDETDREKAQVFMYMLEHTKMDEVVKSVNICFDPDDLNTIISSDQDTIQQYRAFETMISECMEEDGGATDIPEKQKWIIRMEMDETIKVEKNITMDDIHYTLNSCYGDDITCVFSDYNSDKLVFRIRMNSVLKPSKNAAKGNMSPLDQSDQIYVLKNFQEQLLNNTVLRGVKKIKKVTVRKIVDNIYEQGDVYKKQDIWVLDTVGTNLMEVLALDYIDSSRTFSNDIMEVYRVLGIEAARQAIFNELSEVIEFDGTYINYHHFSVLCDRMSFTSKLISIFRHGINNDNIGPIAKASFEETPEMFLRAARHGELDTFRGVSANIMCGQEGYFGTNSFQVVLDIDTMMKYDESSEYVSPKSDDTEIEDMFGGVESMETECSDSQLAIQNNVVSIQSVDTGKDNKYDPGF